MRPVAQGVWAAVGKRSVLLPTLALLVLIATTLSLGNWQVRRAEEKRRLAAVQEAAMASAPLDLGQKYNELQPLDGRLGVVDGRFDPNGTVFLDNRTHKGVAGFFVISLLRPVSGASPVLVLRGWIARDPLERNRLPELISPEGVVRVQGLILSELPQSLQLRAPDPPKPNERTWQYFDVPRYTQWSGVGTLPIVLRQTSPLDDRLIREWVQPAAGIDKNLAYALQWYAMAALLSGFVLYWLARAWRREIMSRRLRSGELKDPS